MLIKVKAYPDWGEEKVVKRASDSYEVYVKEKPVAGLANKRITAVLAAFFGIAANKVRLIKGFKERSKVFEIYAKENSKT